MADDTSPDLLEVTNWLSVREQVYKINQPLAEIIDELDPNDSYPLIRVRYPYGANIRNKGQLQLPISEKAMSTLPRYPDKFIQKQLSYSSSPIGLVASKVVEVFAETAEKRVVPFKLFKPGVCFGVWEIMSGSPIVPRQEWDWSICSGARTVFMLPKISDVVSHKRLQRDYAIKAHIPNNLFAQHNVFKEISASKYSKTNWHTEIIFFTNKWLEYHTKNNGWTRLKEYWAREAWQQALYWFNKVYLNLSWEMFIRELIDKRVILKPYLLDTFKHLVSISCGVIPGFKLAERNNSVAPITQIQEAYLNSYDLKNYAPLIMHPDILLSEKNITNLYYSLQAVTLPEKFPDVKELPSAMKLLRELKNIMDIFIDMSCRYPKNDRGLDFVSCIDIDYYHSDVDKYNIVKNTSLIMTEDASFSDQIESFPKRTFPENSHFLRGCIRMNLNKSK